MLDHGGAVRRLRNQGCATLPSNGKACLLNDLTLLGSVRQWWLQEVALGLPCTMCTKHKSGARLPYAVGGGVTFLNRTDLPMRARLRS